MHERHQQPITTIPRWNPHTPTFYCLPSAAVLGATVRQLRRMQELRDSQLLEKMAVGPNEAFQGKGLVKNVLSQPQVGGDCDARRDRRAAGGAPGAP